MGTPEQPQKEQIHISTFIGPVFFFGIAAVCFYLAYIGMVTGTSYRTASPPNRHRGEVVYDGIDTREEHPGKFWSEEALFCVSGVMFGVGGVKWLREENRNRKSVKSPT